VNPQGDTVIHAAIRNGKVLQYQILAENPEYLTLVNAQGLTALQLTNKQNPQMLLVDLGQWNALNNRVAALELAWSGRNTRDGGQCPVCQKNFKGSAWADHIRTGCS
jgi:ankyrin repeat protein